MEFELKSIPRYNDIVEKKVSNFKMNQRKIWKFYFDRLNNDHMGMYKKTNMSNEKTWYSYCVWEIKNVPRIKTITHKHTMTIKNKINAYMSILSKSTVFDNIDFNVMLCIIEYIL